MEGSVEGVEEFHRVDVAVRVLRERLVAIVTTGGVIVVVGVHEFCTHRCRRRLIDCYVFFGELIF